ncbi:MAG: lysophospholipid acyltransferase family protein [Thioalkalispiraceae bacterium]|jgi:lysophospholipid acyltransferase (LPLAT)-like uncharacterized protein
MDFKRRLSYALLTPIIRLILFVIWRTCKVVDIAGEQHARNVGASGKPFIPCYWHQHHLFCTWYMKRLIKQGLKIGFLISPSVDGEIPAKLARSWGAEVIRGSTTRAGAQTMRDMYTLVVKQGVSPVTTSDGPQGPLHVFKLGDLLLSQFTQAPLLPLAYAADKAWTLSSWDRFMIPKPFSRIAIAIGEPVQIPKGLLPEDLEPLRLQMENALKGLTEQAENTLN